MPRVRTAHKDAQKSEYSDSFAAQTNQLLVEPEFEETLKRLMDRIGKILQAEQCLVYLYHSEEDALVPTPPALGFSGDDFPLRAVSPQSETLTGQVFREQKPFAFSAVRESDNSEGEWRIKARNGISVPLVIQNRDAENGMAERVTVGVLHVLNKKQGELFTDEDTFLLQRMAATAAAVIVPAQRYREFVQDQKELIQSIDSFHTGLLMVGPSGRLNQINVTARVLLGIPSNRLVTGLPYEVAIPHVEARALIRKALSSSGEASGELTVTVPLPNDKPHERIYRVQCSHLGDDHSESESGVVAIFTDITELRNVDRMKTAFIDTVSHELRTPLTSIQAAAQTLLQDTQGYYDQSMRREFYEIIESQSERLTRLINDLLDISRIEQGQALQMNWEWVNIETLIDSVLSAQRISAPRHTLIADLTAPLPLIKADADKLDQVLTNLLGNAIKYSPQGGEVRISGQVSQDRQRLTLQVSDQGIGIAHEHLPHIFDRFYRADNRDSRQIGGTGIGLALVKVLTEAHGGNVSVESREGQGTTFTITLPTHQALETQ